MAEALSTVASGIAVVTVAVQLAESVKKLCDFWNSIKEAPEEIQAISLDLELLSSVLTQIAYEAQHVEPYATLVATLNSCQVKVKILTTFLSEIEPGFASKSSRLRKWTALKAVLKHGQLMKFQADLERLKVTLLLVQQNQDSRLSRNRHVSLERSLMTITQSVSSLSVQQYSETVRRVPNTVSNVDYSFPISGAEERDVTNDFPGNLQSPQSNHEVPGGPWRGQTWFKRTLKREKSVMEYFLGTIRAESNTQLQTLRETTDLTPYYEQDQYEHETSYTIYPATWLIRLGIHHGLRLNFLSSSTQGWKTSLKAFCPVPDDALIFEYCKEGNTSAVRSLLSGAYASVRDTDSAGYTPLHFAAQNHHSELCKVLKGAGADTSTPTHSSETPMLLAVRNDKHITYAMLSEIFDTLRLLADSMDFLDEDGNGWEVFVDLCDNATEGNGDPESKKALLLWMLRLSSYELKTYFIRRQFAIMLNWTLFLDALEEASNLLLNLGDTETINAPLYITDGYTVLHTSLVESSPEGVSAVLAKHPDLHRLGFDSNCTPQKESPTSLAMYSSWRFTEWKRGLVANEVDLEKFIDKELERNSFLYPGWEKETLYDLFGYTYRPELDSQGNDECSDCGRALVDVIVEPYWRHLIERIKHGIDPDHPAQGYSDLDETEDAGARSIAEGASSPNDQAHEPDITEKDLSVDPNELFSEPESEPESESESELEGDVHEYPEMVSIRSDCVYAPDEAVCMRCWRHYRKTGNRFVRAADDDSSSAETSSFRDESSEDEYSPYLIHS